MFRIRELSFVAMVLLFPLAAAAQQPAKAPHRPRLEASADTNNAYSYWSYGVAKLVDDPWASDDAFYWAIQIDPTWADGYYGRWVARMLEDPQRLMMLLEGDEGSAGRAEVMQIDSLMARALTLNPFLYQRLRRTMLEQMFSRRLPGGMRGQVELAMQTMWRRTPANRGLNAYNNGNFYVALAEFDTVIVDIKKWNKDDPNKKDNDHNQSMVANSVAGLHLERGRMFYMTGNPESSTVELRHALEGKSSSEEKRIVRVYESKAIIHLSMGMCFEKMHMTDSAREAYGRALLEDLSYSPAHLALSSLELSLGDTAQALSELALAAETAPNDPATAYTYGRSLILAGRDAEAVTQLKKAAALAPYFAAPHALLGLLYDASDYREDAIAEYREYLSHAVASAQYVPKAKERLRVLSGEGTATASSPPQP